MHALYLHGFASSPRTAKGLALGRRLAGQVASYGIPEIEGGDFRAMTMDGIISRAAAAVAALPADGRPCLLIGSSLGGYVAATLAARGLVPRVAALLLIAPAFGFTARWAERLGPAGIEAWRRQGSLPFFHHAHERELPLGYGFYESCADLPELPGPAGIPVAIVHGRQDETVDHRHSIAYVQAQADARTQTPAPVELHLVEGDHRLTDARHEDLIAWCATDLIGRR